MYFRTILILSDDLDSQPLRQKRLGHDLRGLLSDASEGIRAKPLDSSYYHWQASITGIVIFSGLLKNLNLTFLITNQVGNLSLSNLHQVLGSFGFHCSGFHPCGLFKKIQEYLYHTERAQAKLQRLIISYFGIHRMFS